MGKTVRYITKDGGAFVIACDSTDMVAEMERIHKPSATVTAAMGRLITAASMMGDMLKDKDDTVTLRLDGNGPCGEIIAVADYNEKGKLDVKGAVGTDGILYVIKDIGLKEPYVGQTPIVSGEIAEDITNYFAVSEQTPSVCALGVLVNSDLSVANAGGFIIQLLPGCPDEDIDKIEKNISQIDSVTNMIKNAMTPDDIAKAALAGFELDKLDESTMGYKCNCSRERVEQALISTGIKNLNEMADSNEDTQVECHFCDKVYKFTPNEIKSLIKSASEKK